MTGKARKKSGRKRKPAVPDPFDPVFNATQFVNLEDDATILLAGTGLTMRTRGAKRVRVKVPSARVFVEGGEKYEVRDIVASGGMGSVFEVRDLKCQRNVAMKMLLREREGEGRHGERFVDEARITSQLEHPNIVPVHELGHDREGNAFYTMKLVKGRTLGDVLLDLREGDPETIELYPLGRLLTIYQKICDAVAFAHAHGIIHRDLKPGNIMVGGYGEVIVLDWGLARHKGDLARPEAAPDAAGAGGRKGRRKKKGTRTEIIGTPSFLAPEQTQADESRVDERSDIYALGAILYSLLTLHAPITGRDLKEVLRRIVRGDIVPPAAYNDSGAPGRGDRAAPPPNLPHCPGGLVPDVLSETAMKCMAVDPAGRYRSVKELQEEIEAYQSGQVWHLVIDEDFSRPAETMSRWEAVGGTCEIRDGELRLYGGELQMLLLKRDMPGDVRIEFECREEGTYLNDVGCILSAVRMKSDWDTSISGYAFKYGAYTNSLDVLTRCDKRIWSRADSPLAPGKRYLVRAERIGARLRMTVNNEPVFDVADPGPLVGSNRTVVGLLGWIADTRYSRIRVYSMGTPWKSDILDMAERHLQRGHYVTAMDLFEEILNSFPDAQRKEKARQGYDLAKQRSELTRNLPAWTETLRRAWPGLTFRLRIENEGLALDVPHAGLEDLEVLRGIPLSILSCWGNRLRDVEPLRGMSLTTLNCAGNPIDSLEPLRGMPLHTLRCEGCRVTSLEPLRGLPLATLDCSENRLASGNSLEPLRGMRLVWLCCVSCGVESLAPLEGMPITALFCEANRIADLSPLRGMTSLNELSCKGNRIRSLEPLRGLALNTLHCGMNAIESLEPLRGMPLSTFNCQCNRIASLAALSDMPLNWVMCGGNRLTDLGPLIATPPKSFMFDCDTISLQDLQFIHRTWSRDFRFAEHARGVETLIAARKKDVAALKRLATEHGGHRYLFVPRFLSWDDARAFCEELGGHLVSITSREENDFVSSLFPYGGSWFWIGLRTAEGRHGWVSGEPFEYQAFISELQETASGPWVFAGRNWRYDIVPGSRTGFVIEWEA